jgi:ribosome biogenesis GTPase
VLVDTPGIREVGIWTDTDAVAETFPDIEELATRCRFRDCAHQQEPGCAVLAAVADGRLPAERLDAWRALDAEAASAELRADVVERHRRNRQFGRIAREAQQLKDEQRKRR